MRKPVILSAAVLMLFVGAVPGRTAQDPASEVQNVARLRRMFAVSFLRQLNTAEVVHLTTYGSYAPWTTLLVRHGDYLDKFLGMHRAVIGDARFADAPEILPSWKLRLSVHADGQGYDVMLLDTTDEKCGYAVVSDETAIIRQSKAIDCAI